MDIESLDIKSLPFVRLSGRPNLPDSPGVYFVVDERATPVYYVGQSESLKKRWMKHDKIQVFEHYNSIDNPVFIYYLETTGSRVERLRLETRAIEHFVPLMNYQTRGVFKAREAVTIGEHRLAKLPPDEILAKLRDDYDEGYRHVWNPDDSESDLIVENLFSAVFSTATIYTFARVGNDDPDAFAKCKELVRLLRGFLDYFEQETNDLLCAQTTLIAVTILNMSRLSLLGKAGMVEKTAARRGIGVGSLTKQSTSNDMSLCISESINIPLESFGVFNFVTGQETAQFETIESFVHNGKNEAFKTIH